MDKSVEAVLSEFALRAREEGRQMQTLETGELIKRLDEFLLSIGDATGRFVNILAKEAEARVILEVGSSYGHSTVYLAEAARATGGTVISLEIHAAKQQHAREAIKKAGLADFVDFRLGDARDTLAALDKPVDFVLLDLWKDLYIACFDLFYPKLQPGALVVADNMIFPEFSQKEALEYRRHVRAKPDIQSILLPVGSGIEISRYTRGVEII